MHVRGHNFDQIRFRGLVAHLDYYFVLLPLGQAGEFNLGLVRFYGALDDAAIERQL